jgi:hypothetical protein
LAEPVMLEVRERRSRFGRGVKWTFWGFQAAMLVLSLGTCVAVTPHVGGPDPEVAAGAFMFGAMAIGTLWTLWPLGTLVLGVLLLATRGRKRLIPAPPEYPPGTPPSPSPGTARRAASVPETGPGTRRPG